MAAKPRPGRIVPSFPPLSLHKAADYFKLLKSNEQGNILKIRKAWKIIKLIEPGPTPRPPGSERITKSEFPPKI